MQNSKLVVLICCCCVLLATAVASGGTKWRPVVLMHGLLAGAEAMSHAQQWMQADFPNIYTLNVEIGDGKDSSLLMDINKQVESFAATVAADPSLRSGFNLVCHSQGGLICRAYLERYNNPPVHNFVSWAGPHAGVFGVPDLNYLCPDAYCPWLAWAFDLVLESWAEAWVQQSISFASYWKDPLDYSAYLKYNQFLADINNERPQKNETYKRHLSSLNRLVLVYAEDVEIVIPKTSPWFQFFRTGQDVDVVPFNATNTYVGDWLGLRSLNEQGKLIMGAVPCHRQDVPRAVCKKWAYDLYARPFLNNTL